MPLPAAGDTVSHYRILAKLGEGGMGVVFRARDLRLERDVAVKFLSLEPGKLDGEERDRFYREARSASLLDHPSIATVYEIDEHGDSVFIVMGLIDGTTLQERIQRTKPKVEEVLDLGLQIAEGLQAAHDKGLVHRDIKSANIMVNARGQVRIVDFGLAKLKAAGRITRTGRTLGTLLFMSPEQVRGKAVDHRSDIWSFGVVLYEMLTGELPFKGDNEGAILHAILNDRHEPPSVLDRRVPLAVDSLVGRLLEKDPDRRPQASEEVVHALREVRASLEASQKAGKTKAIAVLPFQNISPDKESDYFGDGLTEELIANLSRLKDIRVVSRTTSMQYKGASKDVQSIGRELGVRYIVEGSVRKFQDNLRITAQLVDVENDAQVWAETFKGKLEDVFEIQEQVSRQIVDALMVKLAPAEKVVLTKRATVSPEAFDCCLRARNFLFRRGKRDIQFAIDLFKKAIDLDARYAAAHAGLCEAYGLLYQWHDRKESWLDKAIESGLRALMYDASLSEAYAALALAYFNRKQFRESEEAASKARELDSGNYNGLFVLGRVFQATDRDLEAVEMFGKALVANPDFYPAYSFSRNSWRRLGKSREFEEALDAELRMYERYIPQHPEAAHAIIFYATALAQAGRREEALAMGSRARELSPDDPLMLYNIACLFSLVGEKSRAMEALIQSADAGFCYHEWLVRDTDLDAVRDMPEYRDLMERLTKGDRERG